MVLDRNGTADTIGITDGYILVESRCAFNRRFVGARVLPDSVGSAITGDRALHGTGLCQVYDVIDDIVLYQRIGRPAVYGQGRESGGDSEAASMGNGPSNAGSVT